MGRPGPKCATKGTPLIAHFRGGLKGGKKGLFCIDLTYFRGHFGPGGPKEGVPGGPSRVQDVLKDLCWKGPISRSFHTI